MSCNRVRASRLKRLDDCARALARRFSHRAPGGCSPARDPELLAENQPERGAGHRSPYERQER